MDAGRFEPAAMAVEMCMGSDGAGDDVEPFDGTIISVFELFFEDAGEFDLAELKEAAGVGVPVERIPIGEAVVVDYFGGLAPADEVAFDRVAVGMRADGANARVALIVGRDSGQDVGAWIGGEERGFGCGGPGAKTLMFNRLLFDCGIVTS